MNLLDYVDGEQQDDWREVPAALFLSWPVGQQLAYCAARDYASATWHESTPEETRWFIERAQAYEAELNAIRAAR